MLSKVKRNKTQGEFLLTDIFKLARDDNIAVSLNLASEKEVMRVNNLYQLSIAEDYLQNKIRKKVYAKRS